MNDGEIMNDGGPAFPHDSIYKCGMSLRDYFAAKAMQGLLATQSEKSVFSTAEKCYNLADAMLAARETKEVKS